MKYTVTHKFNYSLYDLLRAREDRYKYLDKFPDLKNVTLLEEKKEGNLIFQKRKVSLASSLPPVLVPLLDDASLLEESTFNTDTNTHDFKIFPPKNDKVVTISGHSVYRSTSDGFSERVYNIEVKSGVLFVGSLVEIAIEEIHKHSLEKDRASIQRFLDEKLER
ncbi:MAG TPA: DUF2505 family protein [Leptospiraceae bacterium]|nr:DUF2505 family protein [Leptospiraceae bacterium]HMW06502.1 DUF2505 family protein [Leptospiraceae bacterium]HMX33243.1 DUF2505 family protein [Leptospiraceae bacterium]HMY32860.1 DUF2505 family protein [Leptospiraceae bacterium]HMZ66089.1 DUF2505 family protein [Leptospiraceae bacterium]